MQEELLEELKYSIEIRKAELDIDSIIKNSKITLKRELQYLSPTEARCFYNIDNKPIYGLYQGYSPTADCEVTFEIRKYWWEGYEHTNESSSSGWYTTSRVLKTIPELPKNIICNAHVYIYPIINCERIGE